MADVEQVTRDRDGWRLVAWTGVIVQAVALLALLLLALGGCGREAHVSNDPCPKGIVVDSQCRTAERLLELLIKCDLERGALLQTKK